MTAVPTCDTCGERHVVHHDGRPVHPERAACTGHVSFDRDSYVKGQDRKPLDKPRPCRKDPSEYQDVCHQHGGAAPQALTAAAERKAQHLAEVALDKRLGGAGTPVADPVATLCSIAGRAVRFMELLGERVDDLAEIRATDRTGAEQLRAEVAIYERSIGRAANVVEAIVRMGIAERLAKADEQLTSAVVAFIDGVLTDLGHNPRAPEVAGVVARRLELVS